MPRAKTPRTPKPKAEKTESKVLQMPEAVAVANGNGHDIQSEIRRRAYELYESRGYANGGAEQDWIQAEREVLALQSKKHTA
jgi:hypothetical protein